MVKFFYLKTKWIAENERHHKMDHRNQLLIQQYICLYFITLPIQTLSPRPQIYFKSKILIIDSDFLLSNSQNKPFC